MTRFLTPVQQGYYFTFGSVLGVSALFELGLAMVLVQFASHERAHLEWTRAGTLEGDAHSKARLASLLRMSVRWYATAAACLIAFLLPVGIVFFGRHPNPGVSWLIPWIWIVVVTGLTLALMPILAVLEGAGLIAQIARLQLWQTVAGTVLLWVALVCKWGLYVVPVTNTVVLLCQAFWIVTRKRAFLRNLWHVNHTHSRIDWRREVWPLQWKIALSSVSGYVVFQLFNPILFATHGAAAAGRMGLSLSVMFTVSMMALSWVATKAAAFGTLVAQRSYATLDRIFFRSLRQSWVLCALACGGVWIAGWSLQALHLSIGDRILPPLSLALLAGAAVLNHGLFAEAIYLRAHKEEPYLGLSLGAALAVATSSIVLAGPYAFTGMMLSYFLICLTTLAVGTWIFLVKRELWHAALSR
jgi:hypothetical protein